VADRRLVIHRTELELLGRAPLVLGWTTQERRLLRHAPPPHHVHGLATVKRTVFEANRFVERRMRDGELRGSFFVGDEHLPILHNGVPYTDADVGTHEYSQGVGAPGGAVRAQRATESYDPWALRVAVLSNPSVVSDDYLLSLFRVAGEILGLGGVGCSEQPSCFPGRRAAARFDVHVLKGPEQATLPLAS
jgi:hypothetical protein